MPRRKKTQPVQSAPGQPYGQRQQMEQVQQQGGGLPAGRGLDQVLSAASGLQPSGGLTAPSGRPGEPLSAGLSVGPGRGPSQQPAVPPQRSEDPALARLARLLPMLEAQADRPDGSHALRAFVLQLRGSQPADADITRLMGEPEDI